MTTATLIATLLSIIGALTALTNIIVQVLKKVLWNKVPTNLLAVIISMVLTLLAFFAYMSYISTAILWYYVVAAIVIAFMVAYAAMFGYDKLKEIITNLDIPKE